MYAGFLIVFALLVMPLGAGKSDGRADSPGKALGHAGHANVPTAALHEATTDASPAAPVAAAEPVAEPEADAGAGVPSGLAPPEQAPAVAVQAASGLVPASAPCHHADPGHALVEPPVEQASGGIDEGKVANAEDGGAPPASAATVAGTPVDFGFLSKLGLSFLAFGAIGGWVAHAQARRQRHAPRPAPPSPARPVPLRSEEEAAGSDPGAAEFLARLDKNPYDAEARFELGVHQVKHGAADDGVRHLSVAFRLAPELILRLLDDPAFAPLLESPDVRQLLQIVRREHERRVWAGYA